MKKRWKLKKLRCFKKKCSNFAKKTPVFCIANGNLLTDWKDLNSLYDKTFAKYAYKIWNWFINLFASYDCSNFWKRCFEKNAFKVITTDFFLWKNFACDCNTSGCYSTVLNFRKMQETKMQFFEPVRRGKPLKKLSDLEIRIFISNHPVQ